MKNDRLPYWLLTLGLAFVFGWFGVDKLLDPLNWIGWIPSWMDGFLGMEKLMWTKLIGGAEMTLAIGLFIPKIKHTASLLIVLNLIAIVGVTRFSEIGVRDVGLLFMALALLSLNHHKPSQR
jgi:hypothetical protein